MPTYAYLCQFINSKKGLRQIRYGLSLLSFTEDTSMSQKITRKSPGGIQTDSAFLTAAELCQRWKISGMSLWRMRRDNRLRATHIGKRGLRFAMEEILRIESESAA